MELLKATESILGDCEHYLSKIKPAEYTQPIPALSDSTIGQHTRHFIEFYQCLLEQSKGEVVNYDKRERKKEIEDEPQEAARAILQINQQLHAQDLQKKLQLTSGIHPEGIVSNIERELLYNLEHTIHHLAIIKIGIKLSCPEMELSPDFGVAPSTLAYRSGQSPANS